jgi:translocation and assembly module TamA
VSRIYIRLIVAALLGGSLYAEEKNRDAYDVSIRGDLHKTMRKSLEEASLAMELRAAGSVTPRLLRQRAQKDLEEFVTVLRDKGYYGCQTRFEVTAETYPYQLTFHLDSGTPYHIGAVTSEGLPSDVEIPLPAKSARQVALSSEIIRMGQQIRSAIRNHGYPWAVISETQVRPQHDLRTVDLTFVIQPGQRAEFGEVKVHGLKRVRSTHLAPKLVLPAEPLYREEYLTDMRSHLVQSRLFNYVYVRTDEELRPDGKVDILVDVQEQKYRTLFAGISYQSDRGVGLSGGFEHNNIFGRGEGASTALSFDELDLSWKNQISKPDFLVEQQTLTGKFELQQEDNDAYTSSSATTGLHLSRQLGKKNRGRIGMEIQQSRVEQNEEERTYLLYSFPLSVDRTTSDSVLDPRRGYRVQWQGAPYFNVYSDDVFFFRNKVGLRKYQSLYDPLDLVLAGRVTLGTLGGAALADIPADERFYAGGGGSLRGYRYQSAGSLDEENHPIGGQSLFEASLEVRTKVVGNIGLTFFYDVGVAGETALPGEGDSLFRAVGGGLRYHTPIGPIRADVGFPLDRRPGIDKSVQFYISLGHSF